MKYRKKPVVVEAFVTEEPMDIETLEGVMHASAGDYIITGVEGERYPCKPDIFARTYEPADADPVSPDSAALMALADEMQRDLDECASDHEIAGKLQYRIDCIREALKVSVEVK